MSTRSSCSPGRLKRWSLRTVLGLVACVLVAFGLCLAFRDTEFVRHLRRRFMMGSMTKAELSEKQHSYRHAAVASDNAHCSKVGRDILVKGGSAVDSAIATMLCVGVINLHSTGLGGGGFMLVYSSHKKNAEMIDFRETAPGKATADLFQGNAMNGIRGGLAVAVPGELRGMEVAWKKYGKLAWKELFKPSIKLAKNGFKIPETVNIALGIWKKTLMKNKAFRERFKPHGKLLKTGDVMKRPHLAKVLQMIANNGSAEPFYNGPMSKVLVNDVKAAGGILTLEDLRNYRVKIKRALRSKLNDKTLITCPPPTAGPMLTLILNILRGYRLGPSELDKHPVRTYHRIIEAFKFAYKYRSRLADPDYEKSVNKLVQEMMSRKVADEIRGQITDSTTHNQSYYGDRYHVPLKTGTTHLTVLAPNGDAVSVTSTVNGYFGAKFMSRKLGIVYNNEMDDFSAPNVVNEFGLLPSPVNFIKPGKRPQSSAVPTMVLDKHGNVVMTIGAAGGTIITTSVAQAIMNYFWFRRNLHTAISMPRVHDQLFPEYTFAETRFPPKLVDGLKALGHKVNVNDASHGVVQGIVKIADKLRLVKSRHSKKKAFLYKKSPQIFAESDFRKGGLPSGF